MKTSKKGISLIVLAITIIVMIILATAIILSVSGKNMIGTAKEATASSDFANAKHAVSVAVSEWEMEKVEGYDSLKAYAEAKLQEAGIIGFNVSNSGNVTKVYVDSAGDKALIPYGYVASNAKGENTIDGGLVIYEGTEEVNDKNVEAARKERNQFVWVPVDDIGDFERVEWNKGLSISETTSYNMDDINEVIEYTTMYESVNENSGFYIARYEAGKEGTDNLVSKKNATVWNEITWIDAKTKCESMSLDSVVGHLIYGEEWCVALNFISNMDSMYLTDSRNKGWYYDNYKNGNPNLNTGIDLDTAKSNMRNNIYDMAGNVYEWTMELLSSGSRGIRGGSFVNNGSDYPASSLNGAGINNDSNYRRFSCSSLFKIVLNRVLEMI